MQCLLDHIVLNVADMEAMLAFYTQTLELAPARLPEYRAGQVPFPSVRLNADSIIDLFPRALWPEAALATAGHRHLNHFCLTLERPAWEALRQRLEAAGVVVEEGPVPRWGAHGRGISVYFRDPEHNRIEARYYPDQPAEEPCLLDS